MRHSDKSNSHPSYILIDAADCFLTHEDCNLEPDNINSSAIDFIQFISSDKLSSISIVIVFVINITSKKFSKCTSDIQTPEYQSREFASKLCSILSKENVLFAELSLSSNGTPSLKNILTEKPMDINLKQSKSKLISTNSHLLYSIQEENMAMLSLPESHTLKHSQQTAIASHVRQHLLTSGNHECILLLDIDFTCLNNLKTKKTQRTELYHSQVQFIHWFQEACHNLSISQNRVHIVLYTARLQHEHTLPEKTTIPAVENSSPFATDRVLQALRQCISNKHPIKGVIHSEYYRFGLLKGDFLASDLPTTKRNNPLLHTIRTKMNNTNTCFILIDDQLQEGINFTKLNKTYNASYRFAQVQPESNFSYIKKEFLQLAADNRHGFFTSEENIKDMPTLSKSAAYHTQ